jgi:hypothetical protein
MPHKRPKLRRDLNEIAFDIVQAAIGEGKRPGEGKNPEAVKRGRAGGKKGGPKRDRTLSAKRKRAIARKGSKARWKARP